MKIIRVSLHPTSSFGFKICPFRIWYSNTDMSSLSVPAPIRCNILRVDFRVEFPPYSPRNYQQVSFPTNLNPWKVVQWLDFTLGKRLCWYLQRPYPSMLVSSVRLGNGGGSNQQSRPYRAVNEVTSNTLVNGSAATTEGNTKTYNLDDSRNLIPTSFTNHNNPYQAKGYKITPYEF